MIEEVVEDLLDGSYTEQTPVSVVMRATWPDQLIVRGTLADIAARVVAAGIRKTAMICVGRVFGEEQILAYSKLYDPDFSHGYRTTGPDNTNK